MSESPRAKGTLQKYASYWSAFQNWCIANQECPLPAQVTTVARYLSEMSDWKLSTAQLFLAALTAKHSEHGTHFDRTHPTLRQSISAFQERGRTSHTTITEEQFRTLVAALGSSSLQELRDRTMLLLLFYAGMKRSELVALHYDDLEFLDDHVLIAILRRGQRFQVPVAKRTDPRFCPVAALEKWLRRTLIASGPVFRPLSPEDNYSKVAEGQVDATVVWWAVQRAVEASGWAGPPLSTESLRGGKQSHVAGQRAARGILYVLTNPAMPGFVKIGVATTSLDAHVAMMNRASEVPLPFVAFSRWECEEPDDVEARAHAILSRFWVNKKFFRCSPEEADVAVRQALEVSGRTLYS